MHQTTVAKLEAGTRPTDVGEIAAIAAIFGIQPAVLFEDGPEGGRRRQHWRGLYSRLIEIVQERDRLRSRLDELDAEYESTETEYRQLERELDDEYRAHLDEEMKDIGKHQAPR